ncbi:hypothetical protein [Mycobacterium marinum]|uniref:hypothetical protein n=1 Tax=Mycobacterium marinum TaxID=1781 RepID=UPI0019220399|nr:hypothetical protein [Mycobacterium marinum]QQW35235.1 hypothetical protein HXW97_16305 [Mycobacterium marinum]
MSHPSRPAIEALTDAIRSAVRKALNTPEFHDAVDAAVKRFPAEMRTATGDSVAREIERAVTWPVNQAIAEAVGFDTLAQGTHPEVLRVRDAMQTVNVPIEAAVRDAVRRGKRNHQESLLSSLSERKRP